MKIPFFASLRMMMWHWFLAKVAEEQTVPVFQILQGNLYYETLGL
jgi:hypothetical protein